MHRPVHKSYASRLLAGGAAVAVATSLSLIGAPAFGAGTGPTLTLTPNSGFYPCDGVQPVQFSVAGFGADKTVALRYKSASGKTIGTIQTDSGGGGGKTFNFNESKIPPGDYTFYAVQQKGVTASAVFTEGECP